MKIIKTVNIITLNAKKDKILLVKRAADDILLRKWSFIGQAQRKDENLHECAKRILKEDLGVETKEFTPFTKKENTTSNSVIKSEYFIAVIPDKITLNKQKYTEFECSKLNEELFFNDDAFN